MQEILKHKIRKYKQEMQVSISEEGDLSSLLRYKAIIKSLTLRLKKNDIIRSR
jgi:hypothetical protein